jgi:anti-sigma-K factor RskA
LGTLAVILVAIVAPRLLPPSSPLVVAVLNDQSGAPAFLVTRQRNLEIAAIRPQAVATGRALELWAIAGGPPRSLGLVAATGDHRILAEGAVPRDGVLAVSLEPAGGSPTGQPTGPVLYQGKILAGSF